MRGWIRIRMKPMAMLGGENNVFMEEMAASPGDKFFWLKKSFWLPFRHAKKEEENEKNNLDRLDTR